MDIKRKTSVKRQAILDALCATKEHPTAEALYEKLKPAYPDLSLGTVYRNLSLFSQEGLAQTVTQVDGKERFDGRMDAHPHFVCRKCSCVMDVELSSGNAPDYEELTERYGLHPETHSLVFTGLCDRCSAAD